MEKPRILFVSKYHLLTSIQGGSEERVWLLSTELARRGWDVHCISEMKKTPDPAVVDGVTLHALPPQRSPFVANRLALRRLLTKLRPAVVVSIVYDLYTHHTMLEAPAGTLKVWASASEADGSFLPRLKLVKQNFGAARFYAHLLRFVYPTWMARRGVRAADLVLAQHTGQQEALAAGGIDSVVLHNPQTSVPENEVQSHLGKPLVLWAGGIKDWKRPRLFIELARRCRDLDADFVMIGNIQEPKYRAILDAATRKLPHLRYDGAVPRNRVGEYFQKAHLLVSTSQAEGYPNTFIHAMMRGVPIVSLDVNPDRLLTDKGLGRFATNLNDLEKAVRELLANSDKRREIGARAREYAVREFDLGFVVDQLEGLLAQRGVGRGEIGNRK
ncbi:MAG TPA: glycosyltransferase family 4 protein [bacterium]